MLRPVALRDPERYGVGMSDQVSQPGSSRPVFDKNNLLERLMGDEELAAELVDEFLRDAPDHIRTLRELVTAADAPGAQRQAHFIKGAAAAVGATAMWGIALELEEAGKSGDVEALRAGTTDLESHLEQFREAVGSQA